MAIGGKRKAISVTVGGLEYRSVSEACEVLGLNYSSMQHFRRKRRLEWQPAFDQYMEMLEEAEDLWTPSRINLLRRCYPTFGSKIPALLEVLPREAIEYKARQLVLA